jgi:hypothetical protein
MRITKESLKRMISEELGREYSTQDMMPARKGSIMAGVFKGEAEVIISSLVKMNKHITESEDISSIDLQEMEFTILDNISLALDTLFDTVRRKLDGASPESGE